MAWVNGWCLLILACGVTSAGESGSSTAIWQPAGERARTERTVVWAASDPAGDVRLRHPLAPRVQAGTFDLTHIEVASHGDELEVVATFAAPVRTLGVAHGSPIFLPTVDVYLGAGLGKGHLDAPPGRGFTVPAQAAWDHALVLSAVPLDLGPDVVGPAHLTAQGRVLRGRFPGVSLVGAPTVAYAVVLATAPDAEGGVRPVGALKGDCAQWDGSRCTLMGEQPPLLDHTAELAGQLLRPRELAEAGSPARVEVSVVFQREAVLTVAPIPTLEQPRYVVGALVTLYSAPGEPVGTAVVVSRLGDAATLQRLGEPPFVAAERVSLPMDAPLAPR